MTIENPTRLKDGELGAVLRAADQGAVAPERLASNAARIKAQIATVTAFALWKLLVALGILAITVPLAWKLATRSGAPALLPPPRPIVTATIPVERIDIVADAGVEVVEVAAPDAAREPPRPHHVAQREPADAGVTAPVDATAAEPSQLPAQIALYEAARAAATHGELAHAIDLIDQLLRDFPATQLRADAELTRAELLARTDRTDAVAALEALIADPVHAGRIAELLRTLGDLDRRRGDCTRALDAYQRALAAHPGERDRKAAEAGRDHCRRK